MWNYLIREKHFICFWLLVSSVSAGALLASLHFSSFSAQSIIFSAQAVLLLVIIFLWRRYPVMGCALPPKRKP